MAERLRALAGALSALGLFAAAPAAAAPAPARVVSINLCTDELLIRLGDRSQAAGVTWLSTLSAGSNVADEVRGIPATHGFAEQVIGLRPDLVLAGRYTSRQSVAVLRRIGVPVVDADAPRTLDGVREEIRRVAQAIGHVDRGEAMIAELDRRLSRAVAAREPKLRAAVLRPNGFSAGPGSLTDELMRRAGLVNVVAELELDHYGQLPLELVIAKGIDLLIVDGDRAGPPAMATEMLRHPALLRLGDRVKVARVPPKLWTCAGPSLADAFDILADAAEAPR
ncbi:ABC transporter substrate-binding protein [Methylopila henanensis]|uniref:ABC transporter substrate-binding protein n=1 Tax=Methylopila henanensis TaxID=873516 RepID=A0ABW4KDY7_9HYPH